MFDLVLACFIGIGIGVGATTLFNSNQVLYKNETTVEEALNDLYAKVNFGDATASDIKSGKKALVGGNEITGSLTCPTCPSYTNLSGTTNVGAGSYSTLLNGYYYLSDYRIKCGTNSCSACNSCCSSNGKYGSLSASTSTTYTVNTGLSSVSRFVIYTGNSSNNGVKYAIYDPSILGSNYYYSGTAGADGGGSPGKKQLGKSPGSGGYFLINSVSGGSVSVKMPNALTSVYWFAY